MCIMIVSAKIFYSKNRNFLGRQSKTTKKINEKRRMHRLSSFMPQYKKKLFPSIFSENQITGQ